MKLSAIALVSCCVGLLACAKGGGTSSSNETSSGATSANFELICDSTDTTRASTLFCVRVDTRDGSILVVDLEKIPTSNGPTKSIAGAAGTYRVVCDSTDTPANSVFRCVRLHTGNGELMTVRLPAVGKFPG